MWKLPEELLQTLRDVLQEPSLDLQLSADFGAQNLQHKENLRKAIATRAIFSISHTQNLGGFATLEGKKNPAAKRPEQAQVGFDVEALGRVSDEVAARICRSRQEFQAAPSAESLWVAKEAAFKALQGPLQPAVISAIEVGSWNKLNASFHDSSFETFRIETPLPDAKNASIGVTFKHNGFIFGLFIFYPAFPT